MCGTSEETKANPSIHHPQPPPRNRGAFGAPFAPHERASRGLYYPAFAPEVTRSRSFGFAQDDSENAARCFCSWSGAGSCGP